MSHVIGVAPTLFRERLEFLLPPRADDDARAVGDEAPRGGFADATARRRPEYQGNLILQLTHTWYS
jgi:hypothetical protein